MIERCSLFAVIMAFALLRSTSQEFLPESECANHMQNDDRTIKISLSSTKNETGDWHDTLISKMEYDSSSEKLRLDVMHRAIECNGKRIVYIKGVTRDAGPDEEIEGKLKFYSRCGSNIAISNKGLTVQRINADDPYNSAAFTYRPLRDNEIFEVRLDKKISAYGIGIGIGVTTVSPDHVNILPEIWKSPNVWMYHDTNVYSNGAVYLTYKASNIQNIQVGEKIGVMRNEFGILHFFLNGIDQGPAVSNVPKNVYGVIDMRGDAIKGKIMSTIYSP